MNTETYINSGIIEMYVMGALTSEEEKEVSLLAGKYTEIRNEIERVSSTLEAYVQQHAKTPAPEIKPVLMATFDFMQRMENGEKPVKAPLLTSRTRKDDFSEWLNHPDMQAPLEYAHTYVKLISYQPAHSTAIVWLKEGATEEVHTDEYESLFILEGSCDILINKEIYQLYPGDLLTIPLFASHSVKVTSTIPCKLILERRAVSISF